MSATRKRTTRPASPARRTVSNDDAPTVLAGIEQAPLPEQDQFDQFTQLLKHFMRPRPNWEIETIKHLAESIEETLLMDLNSLGKAIAFATSSGELEQNDTANLGWLVSKLANLSSTCRMLADWTQGPPREGMSAADTLAAGFGVR